MVYLILCTSDIYTYTSQRLPKLILEGRFTAPAEQTSKHKLRDIGLSRLCGLVLGKPLDKSQQCSSWHLRPLDDEQVRQ
jgi:ribonuclease D